MYLKRKTCGDLIVKIRYLEPEVFKILYLESEDMKP